MALFGGIGYDRVNSAFTAIAIGCCPLFTRRLAVRTINSKIKANKKPYPLIKGAEPQ